MSIWSKTDGIVDWRLSVVRGARNVQVVGSHIGLSCNAQVYRALVSILERPAQRVGRRRAQAVVEEPTSEAPWTDVLQRRAFRALNAVVRPAIQRGFGTPCLAPWGLVVLEHTGRRTGRTYESPLLALRLGRRVMVTTYRKDRSQWVRNLEEQPETHLWLDGRRKPYRALVLP
ncbi:MAG: nitroreductase/quinone reductase family protein, partial [Proteobacteria bacterium]|nr:nitroreductase/quinone reductase family protein [Pseudomonadota bacterium]